MVALGKRQFVLAQSIEETLKPLQNVVATSAEPPCSALMCGVPQEVFVNEGLWSVVPYALFPMSTQTLQTQREVSLVYCS